MADATESPELPAPNPVSESSPTPEPADSLVALFDRVADPQLDSHWDLSTKRTVLVILLVAVVVVLWISRQVLPMILLAAILAYLLNPIVNFFARFRVPRFLTTLAIFLIVIVAVILLPVLFIPTLIDQLRALARFDVGATTTFVISAVENWWRGLALPPYIVVYEDYRIPVGDLIAEIQKNSQQASFVPSVNDILSYVQQALNTTTNLVSSTATIGFNVVSGIFSAVLGFLVFFFISFYMTMDAPRIQAYIQSLFPTSYRSETADLIRRIGWVWQSFLRGQLILSLTVGTMVWFTLSLVGMPGALIFGILAGLLEAVPNLGPIIAMIPAVITALIQGSDVLAPYGINNFGFAAITIGIYFLIQQLENNILVPRIIGDSINLHPIIVICAVAVGFSTWGILGALLAPPIVATFRVVGSYVHAKLLDYPPFQGRPQPPQRPRTYRRQVTGRDLALERQRRASATDESAPTAPGNAEEESNAIKN